MNNLINKSVDKLLQEAGLINTAQLKVALMEKDIYPDLELDEILVLHGWLKQETIDFFLSLFDKAYWEQTVVIGQLFYEAGLLSRQQIESIISEQKKLGIKFGSVAVLKGFIKQETLDFFLKNFVPNQTDKTVFQSKKTWVQFSETEVNKNYSFRDNNLQELQDDTYSFDALLKDVNIRQKITIDSYEELIEEGLDDIPWID